MAPVLVPSYETSFQNKILVNLLKSLKLFLNESAWSRTEFTDLNCEIVYIDMISSVQFSRSVVSNSLWPHRLQYARLPCPSPMPRAYSNSCPSHRWWHTTISALCHPLLFLPSIFSSIRVFSNESALLSGGQTIGVSASTSVFPVNTQDLAPLGWTDWISLLSKGLSRVFSNTTVQKHQFFGTQPSLWSNSHIHTWLLEKV